jgi:hypothetical protein
MSYIEREDMPVGSIKRKVAVAGAFCALLVLIPLAMAYSVCSCLADLCQDGN